MQCIVSSHFFKDELCLPQIISLTMPLQCKISNQILENVQLLPTFLEYSLRGEFRSFTVFEPHGHFWILDPNKPNHWHGYIQRQYSNKVFNSTFYIQLVIMLARYQLKVELYQCWNFWALSNFGSLGPKNHTHVMKVGHTPEFPVGIY